MKQIKSQRTSSGCFINSNNHTTWNQTMQPMPSCRTGNLNLKPVAIIVLCSIWTGTYFFEKEVSRWVFVPFKPQGHWCCLVFRHYTISHLGPVFFWALPTKAKGIIIVFRFIIEYSSLRDFGPLGNNNRSTFDMRIFER
jgi:hypothetical protein